MLWKNPTALVGTIFLVIGIPLTIVLIGIVFAIVGYFLRKHGIEKAQRQLAALERGQPTQGQFLNIALNYQVSINGRHPWRIDYGFTANGQQIAGSVESFDPSVQFHKPGEPVWVVFVPEDPQQNSIWPPVV